MSFAAIFIDPEDNFSYFECLEKYALAYLIASWFDFVGKCVLSHCPQISWVREQDVRGGVLYPAPAARLCLEHALMPP